MPEDELALAKNRFGAQIDELSSLGWIINEGSIFAIVCVWVKENETFLWSV